MAVRESLCTVGPNGHRGECFATQNFLDLGFGCGALFQDFIGNRAHNAMAFTTPRPCGRGRKKEGQNSENADAVKYDTLAEFPFAALTELGEQIYSENPK